MSQARYFFKKRNLFSSQFPKLKVQEQAAMDSSSREGLVVDDIIANGVTR
jgi:hypothetical protein